MDRNRVSQTISSGLVTAAMAIGVFGLVFFLAIIYIG
jgi:hypothetical protein